MLTEAFAGGLRTLCFRLRAAGKNPDRLLHYISEVVQTTVGQEPSLEWFNCDVLQDPELPSCPGGFSRFRVMVLMQNAHAAPTLSASHPLVMIAVIPETLVFKHVMVIWMILRLL